jgi:hypothetical protein
MTVVGRSLENELHDALSGSLRRCPAAEQRSKSNTSLSIGPVAHVLATCVQNRVKVRSKGPQRAVPGNPEGGFGGEAQTFRAICLYHVFNLSLLSQYQLDISQAVVKEVVQPRGVAYDLLRGPKPKNTPSVSPSSLSGHSTAKLTIRAGALRSETRGPCYTQPRYEPRGTQGRHRHAPQRGGEAGGISRASTIMIAIAGTRAKLVAKEITIPDRADPRTKAAHNCASMRAR